MGFFSDSSLVKKIPLSTIPKCGKCGLHKTCRSPKMAVAGKGRKGILVVGEAPGATEDDHGKPFVGKSGRLLRSTLARCGVDLFKDCWVSNALVCRPPKNADPTTQQIEYCRPNLVNALREYQPHTVILLGKYAVKSMLGHYWKEDGEFSMTKWLGWQIPLQSLNCWVCPTFHPSYVLRNDDHPVVNRLFEEHLYKASRLRSQPYTEVPDYAKQVRVVMDPEEGAKEVLTFVSGNLTAFDYETEGIKPDSGKLRIVCCSVSDGSRTIAVPWEGSVPAAVKTLLASGTPIACHNAMFELRWSHARGMRVKNLAWDSMQAAHVLDNRTGICSLKFQSLVHFGVPPYDDHVKPYLSSPDGNTRNKIRKVDRRDLLLYCGLDSLLEHMLARKQRKELGYDAHP